MSTPLSHAEVCEKFAALAIKQQISLFKDDTVEAAAKYIADYVGELYLGGEYHFTVDPEFFLKEAYRPLSDNTFPWAIGKTAPRKAALETVTGKLTAMFLDAVNVYFARCQIHESLLEMDFSEPVNYFVKTMGNDTDPLKGPFKKVPSTFFGGEQLSFEEIDFPEDSDTIVAYTTEGFLRMILSYQGKNVRHY